MRIGIIAGPFLPVPPLKYGGTEQVIFHLIKGLNEAGHEPILFATKESKVDCEIIPIADKAIYFAKTPSGKAKHQKLADAIAENTSKKIKKLLPKLDIIHSHGFDLLDFKQSPHLVTLHNAIEFRDIEYFTKRQKLNYISISNNQRKAMPSLNYIDTIYNGEDPTKFDIVTKPEKYVCFVGRLDPAKNPHLAIQLAINFGIKIRVAGKIDFEGKQYYKEHVKPLLKHPLVEWLGEIPVSAKNKLVSNAMCNLHPTNFREPFGLTVLEAAYSGTPTLATQRGSMPELIEQGKTGLVVEDFVEGMHRLRECFDMDRQYIARSSRRKFNYQLMTKQYISAYKKVISQST